MDKFSRLTLYMQCRFLEYHDAYVWTAPLNFHKRPEAGELSMDFDGNLLLTVI